MEIKIMKKKKNKFNPLAVALPAQLTKAATINH